MFKKALKSYRFPFVLLLSIIIGSIIGIVFGEKAEVIKPLGDIFLNLLYTIVVPLVFFTVASSIANMSNLKRLGKIMKYMVLVFLITSFIASLLMLSGVLLVNPVGDANIPLEVGDAVEKLSLGEQIVKAVTVPDFNFLLSRSHMLPLIIFALLFGFGVSLMKEEGRSIANGLNKLSKLMLKLVNMIMYYAPIGLCAYFASLIGSFGPNLLGSYARSMALYYGASVIYFFVFYAIYAYLSAGKNGIKSFFKNTFSPTVTSLATQSSLATLPSNMEAAAKIGIPKDVSEVTLPIGVTVHMEGSSMSTILKIAFLFTIFDMPFAGIGTLSTAVFIALLAGVVMSGIPGGGLIAELFIVTVYGFPMEAFPLIATIGWLVDPPATCLNAVGDTASSMLVTRLTEGKNYFKRKLTD